MAIGESMTNEDGNSLYSSGLEWAMWPGLQPMQPITSNGVDPIQSIRWGLDSKTKLKSGDWIGCEELNKFDKVLNFI